MAGPAPLEVRTKARAFLVELARQVRHLWRRLLETPLLLGWLIVGSLL